MIDASIARIRAYAKHRGWTRNKLATEAGLAESTIRDIDSPGWCPTAATLRTLEGIIPADFEPPAESEPPPEDSTAAEAPPKGVAA